MSPVYPGLCIVPPVWQKGSCDMLSSGRGQSLLCASPVSFLWNFNIIQLRVFFFCSTARVISLPWAIKQLRTNREEGRSRKKKVNLMTFVLQTRWRQWKMCYVLREKEEAKQTRNDKSLETKEHCTPRQSRYRLGIEGTLEKRTTPFFFWSAPSDRIAEPTREGVRTAVLRLRRGHAGDDTFGTSWIFWVKKKKDEWYERKRRKRWW